MSRELNWAVLGTGVIANQMAAGLQKMGKSLYAVGNRTHSKAVAFAEKYGIKKVYGTIDEMFYDDNVAREWQAPVCGEVDHPQFTGAR